MIPSELRIGNYFKWKSIASMGIGVDIITKENHYIYNQLREPIPLTEEWLLKLDKLNDLLLVDNSGFVIFKTSYAYQFVFNDYLFLHQLQNLFYALTNKELEIK